MKASWQVNFPQLEFELGTLNGVINSAPPVASWMLGLTIVRGIEWISAHGGKVRLK